MSLGRLHVAHCKIAIVYSLGFFFQDNDSNIIVTKRLLLHHPKCGSYFIFDPFKEARIPRESRYMRQIYSVPTRPVEGNLKPSDEGLYSPPSYAAMGSLFSSPESKAHKVTL